MCGIIGIFNDKKAEFKVNKALDVMKNRGRDGRGIHKEKDNCIGHVLHAIVNHIPQPIKKKGILISNCEIYNWKHLKKKYSLNSGNDSELLIDLIEKFGIKILEELDGVYAFAYWYNNEVIVARDIIGVKPVWYTKNAFASEKKSLLAIGYNNNEIQELNPREILIFNLKNNKIKKIKRKFFSILPEHKSLERIKKQLSGLIINSISKRIPDQKVGVLFSGGIDSTLIAFVLKQLGIDFTCYTSGFKSEIEPEDIVYAKKVAQHYNFPLKIKKLRLDEIETYLKKVVPLIEDTNVVKVGVGLTFYVACELAKKDNIKVIFSGLGSEEIFAGYERHKKSTDINKECLSGILKIHERDLYRDDVITMNNNIELRLPFLDKKVVDYSLKIPAKFKLNDAQNKIIIRKVAEDLGIKEEFAQRKKKAAQYGSRFDKALYKLTRKNKLKYKSEYLKKFYNLPNLRLAALISSGKDSLYATYIMKKRNYEISCLVSLNSKNPDSYMFHTPTIDLVKQQSQLMQIPLIEQKTAGKKEDELKDLEKALNLAKKSYKIEGVITGAIFSNYQRDRIEKICDKLGLKIFSPLWHVKDIDYMQNLIKDNFKVIITKIAAEGFTKDFLGKEINEDMLNRLIKINEKCKINIHGEGGEYETLVLNCPLFKEELKIKETKIEMESENTGIILIK